MTATKVPARHVCTDCNGTGADAKKTAAARKNGRCDDLSYVRCWTCNGNGLDPAAFFDWHEGATR